MNECKTCTQKSSTIIELHNANKELLDAAQSVLTTLEAMVQDSMIEGMIMVLQQATTKTVNL